MSGPILHGFVTFLVTIDPLGVAVIFAGLMHGAPEALTRRVAARASHRSGNPQAPGV